MLANPTRLPASPRRVTAALLGAVVAAGTLLQGCSDEGRRASPVDPPRAREALRTALESWKQGEKPEALKSASTPIVVQDFDWLAGRRLASYEITGEGRDDDANLRIPVRLTLVEPEGRGVRKDIHYVVGTSPALTVFREIFP